MATTPLHRKLIALSVMALDERGLQADYEFSKQYETTGMLMEIFNPHYAKGIFFVDGCIYDDEPDCEDGLYKIYQSLLKFDYTES